MAKAPVARTGVGWTGWAPLLCQVTEQFLDTHPTVSQSYPKAGTRTQPRLLYCLLQLAVCTHSTAGPPASIFVSGVLVGADLGTGYCWLFQLLQWLINIEQIPPRGLGRVHFYVCEEERC